MISARRVGVIYFARFDIFISGTCHALSNMPRRASQVAELISVTHYVGLSGREVHVAAPWPP